MLFNLNAYCTTYIKNIFVLIICLGFVIRRSLNWQTLLVLPIIKYDNLEEKVVIVFTADCLLVECATQQLHICKQGSPLLSFQWLSNHGYLRTCL